jgi:putative transposase
VADLLMATVYEPLRRGGQKTGVRCVGAICAEGRKGVRSLSTAHRERVESWRDVLRALSKRGLRPPATLTPEGALGLTQALEAGGPKSLRLRCWFPKRPNLQQQVPAQAWPEVKAVRVALRAAPSREKAAQRRAARVER